MPFVSLTLRKGKPPAYVRAIADGVHEALVATYQVPPGDRFQVVHQLDPDDFICSPDYLGVERGADAVIIHLVASDWRPPEAKAAFYRDCTARLAAEPGLRPQDVQIVISSNTREDWCFGNGVPAYPAARET